MTTVIFFLTYHIATFTWHSFEFSPNFLGKLLTSGPSSRPPFYCSNNKQMIDANLSSDWMQPWNVSLLPIIIQNILQAWGRMTPCLWGLMLSLPQSKLWHKLLFNSNWIKCALFFLDSLYSGLMLHTIESSDPLYKMGEVVLKTHFLFLFSKSAFHQLLKWHLSHVDWEQALLFHNKKATSKLITIQHFTSTLVVTSLKNQRLFHVRAAVYLCAAHVTVAPCPPNKLNAKVADVMSLPKCWWNATYYNYFFFHAQLNQYLEMLSIFWKAFNYLEMHSIANCLFHLMSHMWVLR